MLYAKKEKMLSAFRDVLEGYECADMLKVLLVAFESRFQKELQEYEAPISSDKTSEEKRQMMYGFLFYHAFNSDSLPPFVIVDVIEEGSDARFLGVWLEQLTRGIGGKGSSSHHFLKLLVSKYIPTEDSEENEFDHEQYVKNMMALHNRDAFETAHAVGSDSGLSQDELKEKYKNFKNED